MAAFEALSAGESPVRAEFHWRTRSGELRLIEWSNTVLTDADGAITHVVGTGIDVTETRASGRQSARRWRSACATSPTTTP